MHHYVLFYEVVFCTVCNVDGDDDDDVWKKGKK
jgi:hypothetical protein